MICIFLSFELQSIAKFNPYELLLNTAKEASLPEKIEFSWSGGRVPSKLIIVDPDNPDEEKPLWEEEVGYMRDEIICNKKGATLGTYERTVDYVKQPDGTILNTIQFHPLNEQLFF